MKKRKTPSIYVSFALLLTLALLSFSSNPPNGRTGAPGESTCSGCHSSPPSGVQGLVMIQDLPATVMPNTTYTLTVRTQATMGSPATGGFQLVVLDDSNNNMGDLMTSTSDVGTNTVGSGREYVEHRGDKAFSASEVEWSFDWMSPASGSGNVNLYAASVLANNNSSASQDRVVLTSTNVPFSGGSMPPTATVSTTDALCFNTNTGTATANASDGTPPYSYFWSNGQSTSTITGLFSGNYTVTVTDANSMTATASGFVDEPTEIVVTLTPFDPLCNNDCNGSIQAMASGGVSNYTFLWSDPSSQITATATGLCAGTYTLTVTDQNGCTAVESATLNNPPPLNLTTSATDASCAGLCDGTATVLLNGAFPNQAVWSDPLNQATPTAVGLCPGTYFVTVTDALGCTGITSATVTEPSAITISEQITNVACNGECTGAIALSVNGGTPIYSYNWTYPDGSFNTLEDINNLCPGIYTLIVSDQNGCTATGNYFVGEPNPLGATVSISEANCHDDCATISVSATGGTSPFSYEWPGSSLSGTNPEVCVSGDYTLLVTDINGCTYSEVISINIPDSIELSASIDQPLCFGECQGGIDLSISGGTGAFNIAWSNGQNGINLNDLCAGNYIVTVTDENGCSTVDSFQLNNPPEITGTTSTTNPLCAGECNGTATVTISGGTSPFTYTWDANTGGQLTATAFNLCPGTYDVTVTDFNGCTEVFTATISDTPDLLANATATGETSAGANDGTATSAPSGGTPGYTFAWSNGQSTATITGLVPASYTVTVTDANGCTVIQTVVVNPISCQVTLSVTGTDVSCNGGMDGSATASASDGTPPYSYSWSTGTSGLNITDLAAGTYSVTVVDTLNCSATGSITIGEPDAIKISFVAIPVSCNGVCDGSVMNSVTGGVPPYTFLWTGGVAPTSNPNNLCAGTYSYTVTDANGCTATESATIEEPSALQFSLLSVVEVSCAGICDGAIDTEVSGGTAPYNFTWAPGLPSTEDQSGLCAGTYQVTVADANGCEEALTATVNEPTQLSLEVTAICESTPGANDGSASNVASGGTTPYSYLWSNNETTTSINNLMPGIYTLTLTDANGCIVADSDTVCVGTCMLAATVSPIDVICNGDSTGVAIATPVNGTPPYSFLWSSGGTSNPETGLTAGSYSVEIMDAANCIVVVDFTIGEPMPLSASITPISGVSCNGDSDGVASITPGGGTGPYSVMWSNGGTNLTQNNLPATGTLSVVDDNGCTQTFPYSLPEPDVFSVDMSSTPETDLGNMDGTATAMPSGGTMPYQYLWSTGGTMATISNLAPGSYSVIVTDANGCTVENIVEVNAGGCNLALNSLVVNNILCAGTLGSATITLTGGTMPYSYMWSSGGMGMTETGLGVGNYTVTVLDVNDCVVTSQFSITERPPLNLGILSQNSVQCGGDITGIATVEGTGGTPPYLYSWPTGGNDATEDSLTNTSYIVSVTDANMCLDTIVITIEALDNTPPLIAPLPPDISVYLDQQGLFSLAIGDIATTVTDNCGALDTTTLSQYDFNCDMVGIPQNIIYTATDLSGNSSTASFVVSVIDSLIPEIQTQNVSIYLDAQGSAEVETNEVILSAMDNCGIDSSTIDQSIFDCSHLGENTIYIVVFDNHGNCNTDSAIVTVLDTIAPQLICPIDFTSYACDGIVVYDLGFSDNCFTGDPVLESGLASGEAFPTGQTMVTYTLTDLSGNADTCSFTITVDNEITDVMTEVIKLPCVGQMDGSIAVAPIGGLAPYTYLWDDTQQQTTALATGLAAGNYSVLVSDSLACDTMTVFVSLGNSPIVNIAVENVVDATNGEANGSIDMTIDSGVPPYTFLWNNGATTEDLSDIPAGTYLLEVTDANGCIYFSDQVEVDNITSIHDPVLAAAIWLAPNPSNGQFSLYFEGEAAIQEWGLEVIDMQGRIIGEWNKSVAHQHLDLDYRHLAEGLYLLRLRNETGIVVKKLVVSRL